PESSESIIRLCPPKSTLPAGKKTPWTHSSHGTKASRVVLSGLRQPRERFRGQRLEDGARSGGNAAAEQDRARRVAHHFVGDAAQQHAHEARASVRGH